MTSNKPFSAWGEIFGDEVTAAAMIDRLSHNAEILALKGDSYRLGDRDRQSRSADGPSKGRVPDPRPLSLSPVRCGESGQSQRGSCSGGASSDAEATPFLLLFFEPQAPSRAPGPGAPPLAARRP